MTDKIKLADVAMALSMAKKGEITGEMVKEAGMMDVAKAVAVPLFVSGTLTGLAALGNQVMKNREAIGTQDRFNHALTYAINNNTILSSANSGQVQHLAQSVYDIAPNAAGDPNVLSSVLANAVHGEGLDPRTARDLMELEEKHHKIKQMQQPNLIDIARIGAAASPSFRGDFSDLQFTPAIHALPVP